MASRTDPETGMTPEDMTDALADAQVDRSALEHRIRVLGGIADARLAEVIRLREELCVALAASGCHLTTAETLADAIRCVENVPAPQGGGRSEEGMRHPIVKALRALAAPAPTKENDRG